MEVALRDSDLAFGGFDGQIAYGLKGRSLGASICGSRSISDAFVVPSKGVPGPPPSALPGISPTGGEITSGLDFVPLYRFAMLDAHCFGKPVRPANLPTCGGDARQGRGGLTGHKAYVPFVLFAL
ncbi:hypothetical protein RCCGE510_02456 [Rhizobium sp. CCGE 510]|nr:hypothetical protein RCCGE510_02456 [Rhizobium sp. CCGE 510]